MTSLACDRLAGRGAGAAWLLRAPYLTLLACVACSPAIKANPPGPVLTWSSIAPAPDEAAHIQAAAEFSDFGGEMCTIEVADELPERLDQVVRGGESSDWRLTSERGMEARLTLPDGRSLALYGFELVRGMDGQVKELSDDQAREVAELVIGHLLASPRCMESHDYFRRVLARVRAGE